MFCSETPVDSAEEAEQIVNNDPELSDSTSEQYRHPYATSKTANGAEAQFL